MLGYVLEEKVLQELYAMEITESGFALQMKTSYFKYWLEHLRPELEATLLSIRSIEEGEIKTLHFDLPFITYPNTKHEKLNWQAIELVCRQLSLVFTLLLFGHEGELPLAFYLSEKPQLMLIETSLIEREGVSAWRHSAPMSLGFNKGICKKLVEIYTRETHFPECEQIMGMVYNKLTAESKRKFLAEEKTYKPGKRRYTFMGSYVVKVRSSGVPHFVVPGNCACLGANPDEFDDDFDMSSHNLDSGLQQLCMLAGVVSFWNMVLKPLQKSGA